MPPMKTPRTTNAPLSETMRKGLAYLRETGGFHFYGNHGIAEYTLDALYRRGFIVYQQRMCRISKFERACAVLTDAGRAAC